MSENKDNYPKDSWNGIVDDRTQHLSLALTNRENFLEDDQKRINESLCSIDSFAEKAESTITSLQQNKADKTTLKKEIEARETLETSIKEDVKGQLDILGSALEIEEKNREKEYATLSEKIRNVNGSSGSNKVALELHSKISIGEGAHAFPKGKEGQMLTIKDGKLVFAYTYPLCEVKTWRHPTLKAGFVPAQGGVIEKAKERYPDAWAYLQTEEGKLLCVTEDEWQAMTKAVYYTATSTDNAGKTVIQEFSFDGIGGAPFYVQDLAAGTLRLPDIRGMYAESSGFDGLTVGGVHLDMVRNIKGWFGQNARAGAHAAFYRSSLSWEGISNGSAKNGNSISFETSRVVPTGNANKPRAWGALVCVFLGTPQPISEAEHDANNA